MMGTGSIAANFHEGTRSEYLAQYVFSSFGTAVAVPHEEDHGLDLICTLTERLGQRAWAKASYTVQVKSEAKPWIFDNPNSVEWLVKHPLPFFLCIVDKITGILHIYHTMPRFYAWGLGKLPSRLEMVPNEETSGQSTQWSDEYKFPLSPILTIDIMKISDNEYWKNVKRILDHWIELDNNNLTRIRAGLHSWEMPPKYETNNMPSRSRTLQWLAHPQEELLDQGLLEPAIRHLSDCLECIGIQLYNTGNKVAGVDAALLYRHLHQVLPIFTDYEKVSGGALWLIFQHLNKPPLQKQHYAFSGIDELQKIIEDALPGPNAPVGGQGCI
jgi:hypothetical protein